MQKWLRDQQHEWSNHPPRITHVLFFGSSSIQTCSCPFPYHELEGVCVPDTCRVENCLKCNENRECEKCIEGLMPSSDGAECKPECYVEKCDLCSKSNSEQCLSCHFGFMMSADGTKCTTVNSRCPVGFEHIQNNGTCGRNSSVLCADKNCQACSQNNIRICTECSKGYHIIIPFVFISNPMKQRAIQQHFHLRPKPRCL